MSPLTSRLIEDAKPLRIRIASAGKLVRDSDALVDQIRAIDNVRLIQGPLTNLGTEAMTRMEQAILEVFDVTGGFSAVR